ncbi:2-C-methyl-D-erythritol 4-phosphate cytidylyltransferase [Vibrio nigripulchritudo ATCC 27043]|uniref:2-C-methyl-D-erythritol 4-phosphate cytidylyltransferase n=1 Tax=Vibrio nigripulchritudo TaxID=28173 RepID=UPI00021C3E65|nr:2-C-methyl-D-erythritol 4-phosphate cytidylyltransferase [Vibrio nigripulchritudo]EGU60094.1 2-C-methyl-D-erythritol 4-phosphate cytidylyltransferase [Vibrio nigripulchritudo ATCC 27043]
MNKTDSNQNGIVAIVPAAGVGSRMQADCPKQYLTISSKTILEHTLTLLLSHSEIEHVVVAISEGDEYFSELDVANHPKITRVAGGSERADSVLSGLKYVNEHFASTEWVLVHDAARPCVTHKDIDKLISECRSHSVGGILAAPVKDTMKRSDATNSIQKTVERKNLWHALTPQMFRCQDLKDALQDALEKGVAITDEASAMEWLGHQPLLVAGRSDNIKITQPEDLALAEFYLNRNG